MTRVSTRSVIGFSDNAKDDTEIHIVGQAVEDHPLQTVKDCIGREIFMWQRITTNIRAFVTLNRSDSKLCKHLNKKLDSFEIGKNAYTPKALYECIDENLIFYFEMWRVYVFKATESLASAALAMIFLKKGAKEISVEALADMTLILSDYGEVVSAQVPIAIQDLAKRIAASNMKDQFF